MRIAPAVAAAVMVGLAACGTVEPRIPYTEAEADAAVVEGMPGIRIAADAPASASRLGPRTPVPEKGHAFTYLALSGGGGGGAYGAGILNGWTQSGTRPKFTVVSGVSTGALIAPFAYLGPAYDPLLAQVYTSGEVEQLLQGPDPIGALSGAGLYGRNRLRRLIERYLDEDVLRAIAQEDEKGRRLLVVTTDLDSLHPVIWDMGAIARSGSPQAYKLFRDVLAASASVPALFAPMLIDVEADGRKFQEMHVDGAVTSPVFTLPQSFLFGGAKGVARGPRPSLFILVNSYVEPTFEVVPNKTEPIAARAFAGTTRTNTEAILVETYRVVRQAGIAYNLTYIDKSFPESDGTGFETAYMRRLYQLGYDKARTGAFWETQPPRPGETKTATR
jgi:predicted acylesterase/phospholipase RssA